MSARVSRPRRYQLTKKPTLDLMRPSPKKTLSAHQHSASVKSNTAYVFAQPWVWQIGTVSPTVFHSLFVPPFSCSIPVPLQHDVFIGLNYPLSMMPCSPGLKTRTFPGQRLRTFLSFMQLSATPRTE